MSYNQTKRSSTNVTETGKGKKARKGTGTAEPEVIEVKEVYEDVNQILGKCVDEIWEMFDDDGNGTFDVDETTDFIKHTLTEMGESPEYSEADFLQCFPSFTEHGKGYMTKLEMMIFIKKVAGIDVGEEQAQQDEQRAGEES